MTRQPGSRGPAVVVALLAGVAAWVATCATAWAAGAAGGADPAVLAAAVLLLALAALLPAPQLPAAVGRSDPAARTSRGRTSRRRGHVTDVAGHPRRPRAPGLA